MIVSRETTIKFDIYLSLLTKWQKTINLVGPETMEEAQSRHFDDSVQLAAFIPENTKTLMDWGSGAGFPGLILAILRPDLKIHLVESDQRKCAFMRVVSRETKTPVILHDDRIESLPVHSITPDVISARAFSPLENIFKLAMPWINISPHLTFILPKGQKADEEIAEAQRFYRFVYEKKPSLTEPEASILLVSGLCISQT